MIILVRVKMRLSFDDEESFKEAVESLHFNIPPSYPNSQQQMESSNIDPDMPFEDSERNEDNITPSGPIASGNLEAAVV